MTIHKGMEDAGVGSLLALSASIGNVNNATVVVRFNRIVDTTSSYQDGITISVNASPVSLSSAVRQTDESVIYYTLVSSVDANDTVQFAYSSGTGTTVDGENGSIVLTTANLSVFNAVGTYLIFSVADDSMHLLTLEL